MKTRFLILLVLLFQNCSTFKKPHSPCQRDAIGTKTENTILSVKKAMKLHVDMIEIDVFVIKSGELVVFHDEILDSLTDSSGRIEDFTLEELQKVVVKGNHQIPTLDEVIETVDKLVVLNIELKGRNTAKATFNLLEKYYVKGWKKEDFFISSFIWEELKTFRKLDRIIPIAVLTEGNPIEAIAIGKKINAKAINPWWKTLTKENVELIQEEGFKIYTYTVNELDDIKMVTELGVDGIFCNFPERLN